MTAVEVKWTAPLEGQCPVHAYSVYYREESSGTTPRQWTLAVKVKVNTTRYLLQLMCRKNYEVMVTAWNSNGETSLNESKTWKVATGGGKESTLDSFILYIWMRLNYSTLFVASFHGIRSRRPSLYPPSQAFVFTVACLFRPSSVLL